MKYDAYYKMDEPWKHDDDKSKKSETKGKYCMISFCEIPGLRKFVETNISLEINRS